MSGFDDFFGAIAGQESGGNYGAVNGRTGALGKFQILPSNVGPWSQQYLGRRVSTSQFLNSPTLQDQLARAVLSAQYQKYGARGAAAWWYSGSASNANSYNKFNANEPSIGEYADQVLARMGGGAGYTARPGAVVDNRVQDTPLDSVLEQQAPTQLDALSGVDRNGLGLKEIKAPGTEAATGGVGMAAPQVAPVQQESAGKQAVGDTFQQHFDAATAMQSAAAEGGRANVIDLAKQYLGTPYVWGGTQPGGFDCSGLIQYAMQQAGYKVPRLSWDQLSLGKRTDVGDLQPGDLVGFGDGGHVALYLGGGQILEAPRTGLNVRVRTLGKGEGWGVSLADLYK